MPKIKDLGINVIPEGMRPLEIGGGAGGACGCTNVTNPCIGFTQNMRYTGGCLCSDFVTRHGCWCSFVSPCLCSNNFSRAAAACNTGTQIPTDITDHTPVIQPGTLQATDIAALRQQLQSRLAALDVHEKALGAEHFDAREQELQKELEQLQARRADLKK
jgi:hypothetical protein